MLSPEKFEVQLLSARVADYLHSGKYIEAGQCAAGWFQQAHGLAIEVKDKEGATQILTILLHWILDNEGYEEAANMLWGKSLFNPEPESAQRVWRAFEEHNQILLMGAASMSKSYSMGVRLFLEWLRDPEYTNIKVLGPSEDHLESNLFSHLVALHQQSSIPLPGHVGKLFIGLDSRNRKGSIQGVIIPLGKKSAGRIQGSKRVNRKTPHPKFGILSRMFIFLDEIANIPAGVWKDIDNVIAAGQGDSGQKLIGAFNPTNVHDEVGKRVEPPGGWEEFDIETDVDWVSIRGWRVVRLDAARCENVVSGKILYPGLQTLEGFQALIKNAGGTESAGYYSMGRGCFPPMGVPMSIIPPGMLATVKATPIWYETPSPVGAVDLAFLGGDKAYFAKGSFGMATGFMLPPTVDYPEGRTVMFRDLRGRTRPHNILLLEALFLLPKGDTVAIKDEVKRVARTSSIRPDWLCVDRTGNGQGAFDLLRNEYGDAVIGVNYSEGASKTKIMEEDHATAEELYDRIQSELWFALRKWIEFGYFLIAPGVDTSDLFPQLTQRRYKMRGKKSKVEAKDEYQARTSGRSPDEADAVTLMVQAARKASGFIPGMSPENASDHRVGDDDDGEEEGPRIGVTDRQESLD